MTALPIHPPDLWIPLVSLTVIVVGVAMRCLVQVGGLVADATAPRLSSLAQLRAVAPARAFAPAVREAAEARVATRDGRGRAAEIVAHVRVRPPAAPPLAMSASGLTALARDAARGEQVDNATHRVDEALEAIEVDGAVVLREVELADVLVRRAIVARQGVFVLAARPALWRQSDVDLLDRQAAALAELLGVPRDAVRALVVLESAGEPLSEWYGGERYRRVECVARADLYRWMRDQPECVEETVVMRLRDEIQHARSGASRPTRAVVRHEG